ncbi:alpha-N-acetylglucosaminidase [Paenibacillus sp. FSL R5-0345]|uniref:alpha-N-acetylglucosaminidase n=1 Tax=Paenibacillus sp. FSL R5-0345 TaxID=1536770 RepID=UPI0005A994FD|nr:alpha-N-acetylglucosaminidase [Paenibacillus sp. FSL R5-0345]
MMLQSVDVMNVLAMIERVIGPEKSSQIRLESIAPENDQDVFELASDSGMVVIKGSSGTALASGFHWYLKHTCKAHLSWCGNQLELPEQLPGLFEPVRLATPYKYRYYLNYCTFSYSMPFWDWERWQQEIDQMAMNGINLALSIIGQEEVWRRTLLRIGYEEQEVSEFVCGPAFFAWQWMQNMTSWGGPLPEWWFEDRAKLANAIHQRMLSLGISPVLPGYSGMVPRDFGDKFPSSRPVNQGKWCNFDRPSLLLADDPMYATVATAFYEEQQKLFGTDIHFYSVDPFHEGGNTEGIDLAAYAVGVQTEMLRHDPQAVWVFQAWEGNPKKEILQNVIPEQALVLDLWCESHPTWETSEAFQGIPWVWCMIQNYGGKNGMFGNLDRIAHDPITTLHNPQAGRMCGIGMAMEGIETNPVMYDLLVDTVWRSEANDVGEWLEGYIERRYGKVVPAAQEAWNLLQKSVYNCNTVQQGGMESFICARPSLELTKVSNWGPTNVYYELEDVRQACKSLFECFEEYSDAETYRYDLTDVTRQALADLSRVYYKRFTDAYQTGDQVTFEKESEQFLQLIRMQERLLRTYKQFLLGPWLEDAKRMGRTVEEKELFEFNARTLITLWGPEESSQLLHEYSHREWSGLIESFYLPRWEMFISSLSKAMSGQTPPEPIDWYAWEYKWTQGHELFATEPQGSLYEVVSSIINTISEFGIADYNE